MRRSAEAGGVQSTGVEDVRTRPIRTVLMVVVLVTLSSASTPVQAVSSAPSEVATTSASCSLSFSVYTTPGLGITPSSGQFSSRGETGTINCLGKIFGHTVTGPGTFGFEGTLTNSSCLYHEGSGTAFFTVPTDAGPIHVSGGGFYNVALGVLGIDHATHDGGLVFDGSYVLLPVTGNCLTEPVTEAHVLMSGLVRGTSEEPRVKCGLDLVVVRVNCRSRG
jgi:hypothetical protein